MRCVATLRWVMTMGVGGDHEVCGDTEVGGDHGVGGIGPMILCYGDHLILTMSGNRAFNARGAIRGRSRVSDNN